MIQLKRVILAWLLCPQPLIAIDTTIVSAPTSATKRYLIVDSHPATLFIKKVDVFPFGFGPKTQFLEILKTINEENLETMRKEILIGGGYTKLRLWIEERNVEKGRK